MTMFELQRRPGRRFDALDWLERAACYSLALSSIWVSVIVATCASAVAWRWLVAW